MRISDWSSDVCSSDLVGPDLHRPPRQRRENRVAVAIEADQAGASHRMLALVEAVERSKHRLQRGSLDLQRLRHGQLALFRVCLSFRPALALGLQPAIELVEDRKSTRLNSSH